MRHRLVTRTIIVFGLFCAQASPRVVQSTTQAIVQQSQSQSQSKAPTQTTSVFAGGSDSAVSRTVGHAEGTRTPNGSKTRAYYGHSDPGNGVWNLGSFSYQHGAASPEAADEKQLKRLERQTANLLAIAKQFRVTLTLEEKLNGIDLANQAPLAALGAKGYIERLAQAKQRGLHGDAAILWARTQAYWDPQRNRWDAPGLGNTEDNIRHDQERRLLAIARALIIYRQQNSGVKLVSANPMRDHFWRWFEFVEKG
ncbi:MAG: hypothetical protein RBJ76_03250 [Stenomitos frigidus ULC029]